MVQQETYKRNPAEPITKGICRVSLFWLSITKKGEIKNYSKQLAKELISEELFLEMTQESSAELGKMEQRLIEAECVQELRDNEKEKVASAMDIIKEIIDKKELTHADLVMLIDKIVVYERKVEGLDIEVEWNTPFLVVSE